MTAALLALSLWDVNLSKIFLLSLCLGIPSPTFHRAIFGSFSSQRERGLARSIRLFPDIIQAALDDPGLQ